MYEATAAMLANAKLLLGISGTGSDSLLELILSQTGQKVLNEINQPALPLALEGVVVEMAVDAYGLTKNDGAGSIAGSVSSVSDNGQSVSYREGINEKTLQSVAKVLKDYKSQLDRFRKTGW